jgi:hypothetical protein
MKICGMNEYTSQEKACALVLHADAKALAKQYAKPHDHRAAVIALLVQTLTLAGGANFLKPQEQEK